MNRSLISVFILFLFILPLILAQEDLIPLRKSPQEILSISAVDRNSNNIEDDLEEKISKGIPAEVSIIVALKEAYQDEDEKISIASLLQ